MSSRWINRGEYRLVRRTFDANASSEPTKPDADSRVVEWLEAEGARQEA